MKSRGVEEPGKDKLSITDSPTLRVTDSQNRPHVHTFTPLDLSCMQPDSTLTDPATLDALHTAQKRLRAEIAKVIVGQDEIIKHVIVCLLARGHVLLIGVPGLAKTLLISTLSQALDLKFNRIQFTPDLMPSDITGTEIIEEDHQTGKRSFKFVHGPVFANVVLADEINRTPPKTQAALLEAMQENQVTAAGFPHRPCSFGRLDRLGRSSARSQSSSMRRILSGL